MSFESLGLSAPILAALNACAYRQPTPIQVQAIPPALAGRDVLGCAQTGTGKTCAFGAPILQRLAAAPRRGQGIRALILTPTRELAVQIWENLEDYGAGLPLRSAVIFGGVGQAPQVERLKRGVDILAATPGRLLDLCNQGLVNLRHVEIFVLDEADRMLDMGFINDVRKILALLPKKKQTLFFSATMPDEITDLVNSLMENPVRVAVNPVSSPVEVIHQQVYLLDRKNKTQLLAKLLREESVKNALVFTRTKHGADKVTKELVREGVRAAAIHGNKSQTARQQALALFKKGEVQVLVATDIAARGLDIEELSYVFNYNMPEVPETYVHRIGRTGRAGRGGTAISFCDHSEQPLLRGVETLLGKPIPRVEGHPFPMVEFEAPRRDAKGRLVNPDDEEARRAARDKRAGESGTRKPVHAQVVARDKKTGEPGAGKPPRAQVAPDKKPGEAGTGKSLRVEAEEKKQRKPARKPREDLETRLQAPVSEELERSEPVIRRNPLEGDVIMDATARMLASKPHRKPSSVSGSPKGETKPLSGKQMVGGEKTGKHDSVAPIRKPAEGNRRAQHKPQQTSTNHVVKVEQHEKTAAPTSSGKNEEKQALVRKETRGRGNRRSIPTVEGPRSHQKDSTEQPSLMKPFYIKHD